MPQANREITFYTNSLDNLLIQLKELQRGITTDSTGGGGSNPYAAGYLAYKDESNRLYLAPLQKYWDGVSWNRSDNEFGNLDALIVKTTGLNDQYLSSAIPVSQSGTVGLVGYTATSIIGALNELKGDIVNPGWWETSGGDTVSPIDPYNWVDVKLGVKDNFSSGIAIGETGDTALDVGFTATSIIGALNELKNTPSSTGGTGAFSAPYDFDSGITIADPGSGRVSVNSATPITGNPYTISVSELDSEGKNRAYALNAMTTGDIVQFTDTNSSDYYSFQMTGLPVDQGTGWWTIPVIGFNFEGALIDNENIYVDGIITGLWQVVDDVISPYDDYSAMQLGINPDPIEGKLDVYTDATLLSTIVITGSGAEGADGNYIYTGVDGNGDPYYLHDTITAQIIRDSTNNYYCIDNKVTVTNPAYNSTEYCNFTGSLTGTYLPIPPNSNNVSASASSSEIGIKTNGLIKSDLGYLINNDASIIWDITGGHLQLNTIEPGTGANFVFNASGVPRLSIPVSGSGNATQMYRSVLLGGYTVGSEDADLDINVSNTFFDATYIDCNTGTATNPAKPDLGVGGALQVIDGILVGDSTAAQDRTQYTPFGVEATQHSAKWNDSFFSGGSLILTPDERILRKMDNVSISTFYNAYWDSGYKAFANGPAAYVSEFPGLWRYQTFAPILPDEVLDTANPVSEFLLDGNNNNIEWTGDITFKTLGSVIGLDSSLGVDYGQLYFGFGASPVTELNHYDSVTGLRGQVYMSDSITQLKQGTSQVYLDDATAWLTMGTNTLQIYEGYATFTDDLLNVGSGTPITINKATGINIPTLTDYSINTVSVVAWFKVDDFPAANWWEMYSDPNGHGSTNRFQHYFAPTYYSFWGQNIEVDSATNKMTQTVPTESGIGIKFYTPDGDYSTLQLQGAYLNGASILDQFNVATFGRSGAVLGDFSIPTTDNTVYTNFRIGNAGNIIGRTDSDLSFYLASNVYFNASGTATHLNTGAASEILMDTGAISFLTAVSATGGSAAALTTKMSLSNTGELSTIELTSGATPATGFGNWYCKTDGLPYFKNDAGTEYDLSGGGSNWTVSGSDIYYSSGNVGIGTSTPDALLSLGDAVSGQKLLVYDEVGTGSSPYYRYGFGIASGEMRTFFPTAVSGILTWGTISSTDGSTYTELMRLKDTGELSTIELTSGATPATGFGNWYCKTDGLPYFKNDAGTEISLSPQTICSYQFGRLFNSSLINGLSIPASGAYEEDATTDPDMPLAITCAGDVTAISIHSNTWSTTSALLEIRINGTEYTVGTVTTNKHSFTSFTDTIPTLAAGDDVDFIFRSVTGGSTLKGCAIVLKVE